MACCHCEALQCRQRLLGGKVANWKLFGPSLVRMHVLRFWCTNCQPLPILGFQTHLQQWSKHIEAIPHPPFLLLSVLWWRLEHPQGFFAWRRSSQLLSKLYSPTHPTLNERSLPHPALVERGLSMFIHWSSFHPGLLHSTGFLRFQMETTAVPPMGDDHPIQGSIMGGGIFLKFSWCSLNLEYNPSIDLNWPKLTTLDNFGSNVSPSLRIQGTWSWKADTMPVARQDLSSDHKNHNWIWFD